MLRSSKQWILAFLILGLSRDCEGWKPIMSPATPEIYITEGNTLELICTSAKAMGFYYPKDVANEIVTSPAILNEQSLSGEQKIILRRFETVHGDTGWYGCAEHDIDVTPGIYDQSEVSWTYVYVTSNMSYFVQVNMLYAFREVVHGTANLSCRPTSPHFKVMLAAGNKGIEMGENASYDPRFGFQLRNITFVDRDSSDFRCLILKGYRVQEINFYLYSTRKSMRHCKRGQTVYMNCSNVFDMDIPAIVNWTIPKWSDRITTRLYKIKIASHMQRITNELTIREVTDEDAGWYKCVSIPLLGTTMNNSYLTVYDDPEVNHIYFLPENGLMSYERKYGDHVQFIVDIDAYPQPKLRWLNKFSKQIIDTRTKPQKPKYVVSITSSRAILRINRIAFEDAGFFYLEATHEDGIKTLKLKLTIAAKPTLMLNIRSTFYLPKQKVEIPCTIESQSVPRVYWTFSTEPNYPAIEGSEMVKLKNYSMVSNNFMHHSVVTVTINKTGYVSCMACNDIGCNSATNLFIVSDVPDGFGIMKTDEMETELMEGDDVEITCAAARDYYVASNWWSNLNNGEAMTALIEKSDRISITNSSTNYSHRSTLRIKNVRKSDTNSDYICIATYTTYMAHIYYDLHIHDPMAPLISETNMNKTTITIDLSIEGHRPVIFKCRVRGVPKPNVTWYKGDTRINANEQYEYRYDNQELYIKYLLAENSGKYTCKVENRFGKLENYQIILLIVKEVSKIWIISIVVLLLICAILVIYFSIKTHRQNVIRMQLKELGLTHFEEGALQSLNPNLTVGDQAELLPYDKKWEFPRERLKFGKQLGFGAFGVVTKADAVGICKHEAVSTVAVKMVRKSTGPTCIRALASELKIMIHLGKHLNVVNLLGACTKNIIKRELLVIFEYCRFGNLHNYLLKRRADFINQIDPATLKLDPSIGLDLLTGITSVGSNNRIFILLDNPSTTFEELHSTVILPFDVRRSRTYAVLSFSRSLSANSSNSNPGTGLVSHTTGTDSQDISMSPDGCILNDNSTLPNGRSNYRDDCKDQNLKPICTQDLLSWAFQVARGMEYLSQRKVLHGDLAARNILLAENNIVKICDFGLAKSMYNYDNYKKKGDAPLPIKWMAIESIRDQVFSTQSDIWSFGVVLWEFFTLAKTPYPGMEAVKQYQRLIEGYRMEQPEYATDEVYDIMLQCWKEKPTLRPTFTYLVSSIGDLLEESVKEHYLVMNAPYMDMNAMVLESGKSDYLTMMSAPDHHVLVSPNNDYVNSPSLSAAIPQDDSYIPMSPSIHCGDSGIFSPKPTSNCDKIYFPTSNGKSNVHSDSESEAVELSPTLNHEDENYLKLIDVQERRPEFA